MFDSELERMTLHEQTFKMRTISVANGRSHEEFSVGFAPRKVFVAY